jgi:intracellular sulfur oxidation DsrE/DsrF family protein
MSLVPGHINHPEEVAMLSLLGRTQMSVIILALTAALALPSWQIQAGAAEGQGKVKVLYHVDGKDPEVAKYALALINKHIDAEGGPDKIDVELVVHGPALELFEKDRMDAEMTKRFDQIIEKGAKAEMCQVSMKAFGKTIDNLAKGFVATLHPVAVKRIADLQKEGYLYIKP